MGDIIVDINGESMSGQTTKQGTMILKLITCNTLSFTLMYLAYDIDIETGPWM